MQYDKYEIFIVSSFGKDKFKQVFLYSLKVAIRYIWDRLMGMIGKIKTQTKQISYT